MIVILLCYIFLTSSFSVGADIEDINRSFQQMAQSHGLKFEEHSVTTDDGYILTLFRTPAKLGSKSKVGPPVPLMHGIFDSADSWLVNGVNSPGYILTQAGYDTWYGNFRGNKYSLGHVASNQTTYWDFGWEELGTHDIPAFTNFILSTSKQSKLAFIGHSIEKTTFALTQKLAYYQTRWSLYIVLAPPWSMPNVNSQIFNFFRNEAVLNPLLSIFSFFNVENMFPANWFNSVLFKYTCIIIPDLCNLGSYLFTDMNPSLNDQTAVKVFFAHYPSGASLKQIADAKKFQRYDYGTEQNLKIYKQSVPPVIDISKIKGINVALFAGLEDSLATVDDSRWAINGLGSNLVHYGEFQLGHLSFFTATSMSYFTDDVMSLLRSYHPIS